MTVAIGITAAVVLTTSSADASLDSGPPNLPDNWLAIWPEGSQYGDLPTTFDPTDHADDVDALAAELPNATATPIFLVEVSAAPGTQRVGMPVIPTLRAAQGTHAGSLVIGIPVIGAVGAYLPTTTPDERPVITRPAH